MIVPKKSAALLVVDVQQGLVDRMGFGEAYVARVDEAVRHARNDGLLVVFARLTFRAGAPEVSAANDLLFPMASSGFLEEGSPASRLHSGLSQDTGDIVVGRSRVSAFHDSGLDTLLRAQGVGHLVVVGNALRAGVLATLFDASARDYGLTVLEDCCADFDPVAAAFLLREVIAPMATVRTLENWRSAS